MFYSNERDQLRGQFFNAWQKAKNNEILTELEKQIVEVIIEHPEYHLMIENKAKYEDKDYEPESGQTNPFLHMSLHLAIRDQVKTNRPNGILNFYQQQCQNHKSIEKVEHMMMEVLVEMIWQMQKTGQMVDEAQYLTLLKNYFKH